MLLFSMQATLHGAEQVNPTADKETGIRLIRYLLKGKRWGASQSKLRLVAENLS